MAEHALPERERLLAETVARLRDDVERLRDAAWTRSVVDVAKGVLIGRLGCDVDEAFEYLMDLANTSGRGLIEVSASLLDLSAGIEAAPTAALPAESVSTAPPEVQPAEPAPSQPVPVPRKMTYAGAVASFDGAASVDELASALREAVDAQAVAIVAGDPAEVVAAAGFPARTLTAWRRVPPDVDSEPIDGQPVWLPVERDGRRVHIGLKWTVGPDGAGDGWRRVSAIVTAAGRRVAGMQAVDGTEARHAAWVTEVQAMLDVVPGSVALVTPIWGPDGELVDMVHDAASPGSVDVAGRGHAEMRGRRILEVYPTVAGTELWQAYRRVLDTGVSETIGPYHYTEVVAGVPQRSGFTVRIARLGGSLLVSWDRLDNAERLASMQDQIQRLGNLGWGRWNLVTGEAEWSEQLYRVLGRESAAGPATMAEVFALIHPDDVGYVRQGIDALLDRDEPFDVEYRSPVGGETRHLRAVAEVTRDATGRAVEMYCLVQDISTLRQTRQRLEVIRRELEAHQQLLAEEHRLAVQLQRIILPVPEAPLAMPGMRVAVRYVPAERLAHVGGDWFQVNPLPDGALLLAVGDVAGHGLAAAATMAQLRHALAGLAMITHQPAAILGALNSLLCGQPGFDSLLATAVVARYQPDDRTLTWAQAGHPPALLARTSSVAPLRRPEGMLLGASQRATYDQMTERMEPGDMLLLYTDGLIEAPGVSLDDGLQTLAAAVKQTLHEPTRDPLTAVIRRLRRANPGDDTCILAAQLT